MTIGDFHPEEDPEAGRTYELIYEVSDRAKAMAPTIAGTLRAAVVLVSIPAVLLAVSAIFPIVGVAIIAKGANFWPQIILFAFAIIAALIEILFCHRLRLYTRAIRAPEFIQEVAELVDVAEMSDEFLARLRAAGSGGLRFKGLKNLWRLWRKPNYFSDRIDNLPHAKHFVPPRINFNIKLAIVQFWAVAIMWGVLVITLIARLAGSI